MVCTSRSIAKRLKLTIALQARSTPSLGMRPIQSYLVCRTDSGRPVVVAENMIGVAMYELVGSQIFSRYWPSSHKSRFE